MSTFDKVKDIIIDKLGAEDDKITEITIDPVGLNVGAQNFKNLLFLLLI